MRILSNFSILKENDHYLEENIILIEKMKIRGLFTISHKRPDNCVLLEDNRILLIRLFYYVHDKNVKVLGIILKKKCRSVFQYPSESSHFQIWEIKEITNETEVLIPIDAIKNKFVYLKLNFAPLKQDKEYVIPLLHS